MEIAAVGKAAEAVGKRVLGEDEKTKDVLLRLGEDTPEMMAAARTRAARIAAQERAKTQVIKPFLRMVGVSREYFDDVFPRELADKTVDIPDEHFITPMASVAVPALLGLSYTYNEPNLKDLYLNLLTTASDNRRTGQAHPAFAEIIKQLASDEASSFNSLMSVLSQYAGYPIARVKFDFGGFPAKSYSVLFRYLLPLTDDLDPDQPQEEPQLPIWVDNWQRLGLMSVTFQEYLADGDYGWIQKRPEYIRLAAQPDSSEISYDKGVIRATDFGLQFFRAVS